MRDRRLDTDPDFICSPKHDNSLKKFMDDHPDGVPDATISRVLKMTEEEVEETWKRAILKLRKVVVDDE